MEAGVRRYYPVLLVCFLVLLTGCLHGVGTEDENITNTEEPNGEETVILEEGNSIGEEGTDARFSDISSEVGFDYSDDYETLFEGVAVSGVYVSDHDNDGRTDILAVGEDEPILFESHKDGFRPTELPVKRGFTAAHFFDHNNNGWDDLYLLSDEGSVFLENKGGEFVEREVGLGVKYDSVRGAATADYTRNGCLDVFVIQSNDWEENRPVGYDSLEVGEGEDNGNENRLFAGDCDRFEEKTNGAGIEGERWSLATSFVDLTNDGYPDIHIANDFNKDVLYLNQGDGTFERRVMPEFTNRNGMSSEVTDVTGNGYLDIFVTNIYFPEGEGKIPEHRYGGRLDGNNLLLNNGDGKFDDRAEEYGVRRSFGWGWAAVFDDFNNDGSIDLVHTLTGSTGEGYLSFWGGSDRGFESRNASRLGFEKTRGVGLASLDYNLDGRLDIVESNQQGSYKLYENRGGDGNWLRVDVESDGETTEIGAVVEVTTDHGTEWQVKDSGSDYLSQDSRPLQFGLGDVESAELRVEWPDGTLREWENVEVNRRWKVSPDDGLYLP